MSNPLGLESWAVVNLMWVLGKGQAPGRARSAPRSAPSHWPIFSRPVFLHTFKTESHGIAQEFTEQLRIDLSYAKSQFHIIKDTWDSKIHLLIGAASELPVN